MARRMGKDGKGAANADGASPLVQAAGSGAGAGADLLVRAASLAASLPQGMHPASGQGGSTEFYDFRAYSPGDEPRRVDWKLFGRTDRHYIRRFEHRAQQTVILALDTSASMRFAGFPQSGGAGADRVSKLVRGAELVAAISAILVRQGDRVGLALADGSRSVRPATGRGVMARILRALHDELAAETGAGGVTSDSLRTAAGLALDSGGGSGGGGVIAVTDALDEVSELAMALAGVRAADRLLCRVLDPDELSPGRIPEAVLWDPEEGKVGAGRGVVGGASSLARYRDAFDAHAQQLHAAMEGLGIGQCLVTTDAPMLASLRRVVRSYASPR